METTDEISIKIDDVDRKIIECSNHLDTVGKAIYELRRKIVMDGLDLDNLKQDYKKGRFNLELLKVEKEMLTRKFWRTKQ